MSVMKDYAKQNYRKQETSFKSDLLGTLALFAMGAILGGLLGYGLLYT